MCTHLTFISVVHSLISISITIVNHHQSKSPLSTTTVHHGFHHGFHHQQHTAKRIMEVGECVDIVVQHSQHGFSHAIHCGKEFLGDERFMVVSVFSPLVTGT
jgi:UTP-glucose-1-phosphate uridylyltransferase